MPPQSRVFLSRKRNLFLRNPHEYREIHVLPLELGHTGEALLDTALRTLHGAFEGPELPAQPVRLDGQGLGPFHLGLAQGRQGFDRLFQRVDHRSGHGRRFLGALEFLLQPLPLPA